MRSGLKLLLVQAILMMSIATVEAEEKGAHICFRQIDANGDGIVTYEEFTVHFGKDKTKFTSADANGDSQLTHDEYHDFLGHGVAGKPKNR